MIKDVEVVPDNVMRERVRSSLNRLPDYGDWEPGSPLTDIMRDLYQPVGIHRKTWEYAICILGLRQLGALQPTSRGLAVGAGAESPLFYFANNISSMVATDLYDNPDHEGTPVMLSSPRSFAPFPYREEHLEVHAMSGDDLKFEAESFDFVFCLSSIEHFGSRETQRKSLEEMKRVTKKGGSICIITELILSEHTHNQYFSIDELKEMFFTVDGLSLVGGELDLSISESLIKFPTNIDTSRKVSRSPHIVLDQGGMLWTSLSMFFTRT